ncbi:MAG TPA: ABC transporter ATP-binding protein [Alphaproteobacteria bacterium]|nr:ABC transporter ATP-binding protein [Alphaproteobacteria bacterium]
MAAPRDVIAAFRGVRKTFDGETLVVRNLDLDIYRGEFLTLLGPSGSGKTTTLMMLAGFETPTAGDVTLEGRSLTRLPPHKREIGMVFQNYALFPHMTVAENIAFPLSVRGVSREETTQRIKRALGMVRLEGYEQRRPNQLSGGQQQRVALARALVFEPKLVLMDEPLGALDKQLREEMQFEIRHIHERLGVTVVYVTHDQAEALTMSDRIAVFHRGEVQQIDTLTALYERPRNAFVARFIGENNRLRGTLEHISQEACTVRLTSGARIAARAVDAPAPGSAVIVSLRPERIALGSTAPQQGTVNRLPATVRELIYLGDHIRARIELEGGESCMVKLPITQHGGALTEGAPTDAIWRAEDGLAMAPET